MALSIYLNISYLSMDAEGMIARRGCSWVDVEVHVNVMWVLNFAVVVVVGD